MEADADPPHCVEPVPIDDDLCTELSIIEDLGYAARFVFTHQQTIYETGEPVTVIKDKIVLPYSAIQPMLEMTIGFLSRRAQRAGGPFLRLVK